MIKTNKNNLCERVRGVEPLFVPWEGTVKPFNYTRIYFASKFEHNLSSLAKDLRFDYITQSSLFYLGKTRILPGWIVFGLSSLFAFATSNHLYPSPYALTDISQRLSPLTTV